MERDLYPTRLFISLSDSFPPQYTVIFAIISYLIFLGLRTLVVAKKSLTLEQYLEFENKYNSARMNTTDRSSLVHAAVESLEREMELVCLTGVEDRLQDNVRPTLEVLRHAGVKV